MPGAVISTSLANGFPGSYSRNGDCIIYARPVNVSDPYPIIFGDAVFGNSYSALPGGTYSSTESLQANVTATTASSTTITGIANTATAFNGGPLVVGMQVVGPGLPSGATIATIASSTSITISAAATASATITMSVLSALVTPSNFIGVAVREVKTNTTTYNSSPSNFGRYNQGQECDALERGSCVVSVPVATGLAVYGQVYLRVGLNTAIPAGVIGGFESAADLSGTTGYNTIALTGVQWTTGVLDSNNVAEITLKSRNNP